MIVVSGAGLMTRSVPQEMEEAAMPPLALLESMMMMDLKWLVVAATEQSCIDRKYLGKTNNNIIVNSITIVLTD